MALSMTAIHKICSGVALKPQSIKSDNVIISLISANLLSRELQAKVYCFCDVLLQGYCRGNLL